MNALVIHVVQVHVPMRSPITPAIVLKLDLEVSDDSEHFEKKKIPSKNESTSRNFSGDNCEEDIDECEERNQCLGINNEICSCFDNNTENCFNIPGSYNCSCQPGFCGTQCQRKDPCQEVYKLKIFQFCFFLLPIFLIKLYSTKSNNPFFLVSV